MDTDKKEVQTIQPVTVAVGCSKIFYDEENFVGWKIGWEGEGVDNIMLAASTDRYVKFIEYAPCMK